MKRVLLFAVLLFVVQMPSAQQPRPDIVFMTSEALERMTWVIKAQTERIGRLDRELKVLRERCKEI